MKKILLIVLLLSIGFSSGQEPIDGSTLVWKDGLLYASDSEEPYNGEAVWYYDNGQKKREGTFKDGEEDGLWTEWSPDGQESSKILYINGKLWDGTRTNWWENGQKSSEGTYNDGELDGLWTFWYENGQKSSEGTYKDGKLNGPTIAWYESGEKQSEGTYKDGKEEKWTEWYKNGHKFSEYTFKDGKVDGLYIRWHENGQKRFEVTYKDGEQNGKSISWYENGQKEDEGNNKDGLMNGLWVYYYENGNIKVEGHFKDGNGADVSDFTGIPQNGRVGNWDFFYESGVLSQKARYKNGVLEGLYNVWWENGIKKEKGYYKNGKIDRIITSWYNNGQKSSEGTYKDGKLNGPTIAWYESGEKQSEGKFVNGNGLLISWYKSGEKKSEGTYNDGELDGKWTYWYENGQKEEEGTWKDGELIDIDFALLLDKKIHCTDDSIMVSKIDIESEKYLIPYDEPYSTQLWLKVVDNLFVAGASHIIFNSNIPNITESYMDIEKNYNNVYRTMNKNELNSFHFDCPVKIKEYFSWDISLAIPVYGLSNIIDTEDITLRNPFEDFDWMDQFLPGQIPEWITAIEDEAERKEIMEALGVGDDFDITQSPFYNNVILIGF